MIEKLLLKISYLMLNKGFSVFEVASKNSSIYRPCTLAPNHPCAAVGTGRRRVPDFESYRQFSKDYAKKVLGK